MIRSTLPPPGNRESMSATTRAATPGAVAEQAIMLMLMLLRHGRTGDLAVREGRQMEVKERYMQNGIRELSACRVGLVGFGDIAKATAEAGWRRLDARWSTTPSTAGAGRRKSGTV